MEDISHEADDSSKRVHKTICLRLPKEMLDRIDVSAKNARGYNRTTWVLQALDKQLKSGEEISNPYKIDISEEDNWKGRMIDIDKNIITRYAEDMKVISRRQFFKILTISILAAGLAGCVGGAMGSLASVWSMASGVSMESVEAHNIAPAERATLVKEIKQEVIKDLSEKPVETIEVPGCIIIEESQPSGVIELEPGSVG